MHRDESVRRSVLQEKRQVANNTRTQRIQVCVRPDHDSIARANGLLDGSSDTSRVWMQDANWWLLLWPRRSLRMLFVWYCAVRSGCCCAAAAARCCNNATENGRCKIQRRRIYLTNTVGAAVRNNMGGEHVAELNTRHRRRPRRHAKRRRAGVCTPSVASSAVSR